MIELGKANSMMELCDCVRVHCRISFTGVRKLVLKVWDLEKKQNEICDKIEALGDWGGVLEKAIKMFCEIAV